MIRSWNVPSRTWLAAVLLLPLPAFAAAPALSPEARLTDVCSLIQADRSRVALERRAAELKDVSILSWRDQSDVMVVTFGLVNKGQRTGQVKRQYWGKEGGQWKIFFEGVIG